MSKYADLRWKIADLEKALEQEKTYSKKLRGDMEKYILMVYEKDKIIDELTALVRKLKVELKGGVVVEPTDI